MTLVNNEPMTKELLTRWLKGEDLTEEDATPEVDYEQALRILNAESPEAALSQDDVRKVATLADTTFVIRGVTWRRSTKAEDGEGRYAVMSCVDANGEAFLSSCGATKVILQLRKAEVAGWLPWQVTLNTETTSNNRTIYELVAPEQPF